MLLWLICLVWILAEMEASFFLIVLAALGYLWYVAERKL